MIGDNARQVITSAKDLLNATRVKSFLNLKGIPLKPFETPEVNPDVVITTGNYSFRFMPYKKDGTKNTKKFVMSFDFLNKVIKFRCWRDFEEQAKSNDIVKFFKDFTNISKDMFRTATRNMYMVIPVHVDYVKLEKHLLNQLSEEEKAVPYIKIFNPYGMEGEDWE